MTNPYREEPGPHSIACTSGPTTIIPTATKASIAIAAAAIATTAVLLAIPIPDARHHRVLNSILNLGHVPLFAVLATIAFWLFGARIIVGAALVGLAAAGELFQSRLPGRTMDWHDLLHGVVGIALAWLWWRGLGKVAWRIAGTVALLLLPLVDLGPNLFDALQAKYQFPVLCDSSGLFERYRWKPRQARIVHPEGITSIAFDSGSDEYPGSEFVPIQGDWSDYETLVLEFEIEQPLEVNLSILDQREAFGYEQRFNFSQSFEPGRHRLVLSLADIANGATSKPLDLTRMDSLNFFISVGQAPAVMQIHRMELAR